MSLTVKQTGSLLHAYTLTDAAGTALDLTGFTTSAAARMKRHTATTQTLATVDDDLPNGIVSLSVTPAVSALMEDTDWEFDLKAVSADTLTVYFTDTETLTVKENIT